MNESQCVIIIGGLKGLVDAVGGRTVTGGEVGGRLLVVSDDVAALD